MAQHAETDAGRGTAEEASLGELVATATRDLSLLVRQEIELAKAELTTAAKNAGIGAGMLGVAGFLGLFAFLAVTIGFAEGLHAAGLFSWAAYLVVAGVYLLLAGVFAIAARGRLTKLSPPKRTVQTVKDDIAWARHPTTAPTSRT